MQAKNEMAEITEQMLENFHQMFIDLHRRVFQLQASMKSSREIMNIQVSLPWCVCATEGLAVMIPPGLPPFSDGHSSQPLDVPQHSNDGVGRRIVLSSSGRNILWDELTLWH
jgi:hypothetical protein